MCEGRWKNINTAVLIEIKSLLPPGKNRVSTVSCEDLILLNTILHIKHRNYSFIWATIARYIHCKPSSCVWWSLLHSFTLAWYIYELSWQVISLYYELSYNYFSTKSVYGSHWQVCEIRWTGAHMDLSEYPHYCLLYHLDS